MTFQPVSDRARRRLVWIAPFATAAVIALVATMTGASSASVPNVKPMTARQLIAAVQQHAVSTFSGTITETTDLGLPALPGAADRASLSWTTFLSGTHSFRSWSDGPQKQRLALIGQLSEAEVVHNGNDVWTYTSHTNSVSHTVLPSTARLHEAPETTAPTPNALADRLLKAITPSTAVRVDTAQTVARRAAYTLSLAPKDARSTIRRATIAIDATTFLPLRVQVFGSGSSPAISVGFSDISYARPAASTFVFHAPKGATVQSNPLTAPRRHDGVRHHDSGRYQGKATAPAPGAASTDGRPATGRPTIVGSGWTAVLEARGLAGLGGSTLQDATTSLSGGRRLLHTALLNAVFLPDGRAFVGAVKPAALEQIAATTPR